MPVKEAVTLVAFLPFTVNIGSTNGLLEQRDFLFLIFAKKRLLNKLG